MGEEVKESVREPIFRDFRRYFCEFCGTSRSKKYLITKHIQSDHKEEVKNREVKSDQGSEEVKNENKCGECGMSFMKPAHLKQHMLSHSFERPFVCPLDDCQASFRRKYHLDRHLDQHKGKLFKCTVEGCDMEFSVLSNMKRHVKEMHDENSTPKDKEQKKYVCQESGCGKEFTCLSRLRTHEESHVNLDSSEAFCADPSCMKYFSNSECLKAHMRSCHQHVICEVCGCKHLKKNIKRHLRTHEEHPPKTIKCNFEGCDHEFTTNSNLQQHVKAVHLKIKPFVCSIPGCGMRFAFKHVRDNHEKAGCHAYVHGDIEEFDEQFRSRPRGGRKRAYPATEMLTRKRVQPLSQGDRVGSGCLDYLAWLLSENSNEQ